jgi:hypothetical protein
MAVNTLIYTITCNPSIKITPAAVDTPTAAGVKYGFTIYLFTLEQRIGNSSENFSIKSL